MGANTFTTFRKTPDADPRKAFGEAVQQAQWEYGHSGYSGTIAEKGSVVVVGRAKTRVIAHDMAQEMISENDDRIDDKWGPAGAIEVMETEHGWLFFGWASS